MVFAAVPAAAQDAALCFGPTPAPLEAAIPLDCPSCALDTRIGLIEACLGQTLLICTQSDAAGACIDRLATDARARLAARRAELPSRASLKSALPDTEPALGAKIARAYAAVPQTETPCLLAEGLVPPAERAPACAATPILRAAAAAEAVVRWAIDQPDLPK